MRTWVITIVFAAIATCANAQQPSPSGRLFFTPEQRSALDAERKQAMANALKPKAPPVTEVATAPKAAPKLKVVGPQVVTLNGVVRRSDGQSTVWLNNKAVQNGSAASGVATGSVGTNSVDIKLNNLSKHVELKVGQTVSSVDGRAEEAYKHRRNPKYLAPQVERDSSPDLPTGKSSESTDNASDTAGAGTTESSNPPAR